VAARQRDRLLAAGPDGAALVEDPAALEIRRARVSDSGEGRWTIKAAIDEGVPVPVLTTALYERFSSRGEADYQDKLLSAMRFRFGGHLEKPAENRPLERRNHEQSNRTPGLLSAPRATWPIRRSFPALQAMVKRGHLNVPVIGVAKAGWNLDQFRARAHDSLEKHGGLDPAAFEKLQALRAKNSGPNGRRIIWPSRRCCSGRWWSNWQIGLRPGRSRHRREALRHDLPPRRSSTGFAPSFPRVRDLSHRPLSGQAAGEQRGGLPFRQRVHGAVLESQLRRSVQITMAEDFGVEGRGAFYDQTGTIRDVIQNHLFPDPVQSLPWSRRSARQRIHSR
jgi:hypothetical protein